MDKGILYFNSGNEPVIRSIVSLYSLRKHWNGNVTIFLEKPYPDEFKNVCDFFDVDFLEFEGNKDHKVLVRKTEILSKTPYDETLWIDSDTIICGKIDEMFGYLDDCSLAIPHFSGWFSDKPLISNRIKKYRKIANKQFLDKALEKHPAINTGILSYKRDFPFIKDWIELAIKGSGKMFIPDEVAFQVLYPSYEGIFIAPQKFNVSVKYGNHVKDKRIIHYHGKKHCLDFPLCDIWKKEFEYMRKNNIANINSFLKYSDKRLKKYISLDSLNTKRKDVTIVTACDEKYVEILKETFPNWVKYKKINEFPIIVFVNGMSLDDKRLDFLREYNVKLIEWDMSNVENHREKMLSAFVFGTAEYVETDYWLKIDADSFATDDRELITEDMKKYAFCGHKWGYSRPEHIRQLDVWAKNHWKRKLKNANPMINEGRVEGRRFYHNTKRTISYIQLHKTKFTKFCVGLLKEKRLPAPTQDTFMFYVANRFNPESVGIMNFKRDYGFTQGNGRKGINSIKNKMSSL